MENADGRWPVLPMEPTAVQDAFDSPDFLFQVKWDGVRCLAYRYPDGALRLFNRRLNERTRQYPDLMAALAFLPPGTVIDGEIIATGADGKPSFPLVLRRDLVKSAAKAGTLAHTLPASYMAFDLLWLEGVSLLDAPLAKRQERLRTLPLPKGVQAVDSVEGSGRALFAAVGAEGLEGIVAKRRDSPYLVGKKTMLWQKIKHWREITVWAGGYLSDEAGRIRSLLVGTMEEGGLRYVGSVASGVTQRQWRLLQEHCDRLAGPCPFVNPPLSPGARWVKPLLSLRVRFLEYSPNGSLRNPSVVAFTGGLE